MHDGAFPKQGMGVGLPHHPVTLCLRQALAKASMALTNTGHHHGLPPLLLRRPRNPDEETGHAHSLAPSPGHALNPNCSAAFQSRTRAHRPSHVPMGVPKLPPHLLTLACSASWLPLLLTVLACVPPTPDVQTSSCLRTASPPRMLGP